MSSLQNTTTVVDVENIGGIDSTTAKFTPGVTVLAAETPRIELLSSKH